jgi:hypothetical protein
VEKPWLASEARESLCNLQCRLGFQMVFRWYKSINMICDAFLSEVTLCDVWALKARFAEHAAACSSFAYGNTVLRRASTLLATAVKCAQTTAKGGAHSSCCSGSSFSPAQTDFPKAEFAFGRCHDAEDVT